MYSLKRTERLMVRWMCGVLLRDRNSSLDLYLYSFGDWLM